MFVDRDLVMIDTQTVANRSGVVCTFSFGDGGGVYAVGDSVIDGCTFDGNETCDRDGGLFQNGEVEIIASMFTSNLTPAFRRGGGRMSLGRLS